MTLRACIDCGRPSPGSRCPEHAIPRLPRSGTYTRTAAKVRAEATACWICGTPFADPNDPPVADHVIPRAYGGSDDETNLRAAHQSCNSRRGAQLGNEGAWTLGGRSRS